LIYETSPRFERERERERKRERKREHLLE